MRLKFVILNSADRLNLETNVLTTVAGYYRSDGDELEILCVK